MTNYNSIYRSTVTSGVINREFKEDLSDNINTLSEKILRDRSFLKDKHRLNNLIETTLIKI